MLSPVTTTNTNRETSMGAAEMIKSFRAEYVTMTRDPLFAFYGGVASPAGEAAYVARRAQEVIVWTQRRIGMSVADLETLLAVAA